MALTPGTRIGPYEVVAQIGEGGMGAVYRARDTKLGRDVALKVLPDAFVDDADRLARFEREARVLASLNHPNIAQIYGLEHADGVQALVMELVPGPTLAELIATRREGQAPRAIDIDDALAIARQIAAALDAAHEQGIIHRDLKPANVKVRDDGTVKVLDFGLAKAVDPARTPRDIASSPTITSPAMTEMGIILGTAAYMAPEQARGRPVDKRADIWAFGCVLYEMLTGQRLFGGEDLTETLAAVVKTEPDLSAAPPRVHRLLRKCLEKDPRRRLRDIGDAWELLEDEPVGGASVPARAPRGRLLLASAIGLGLALAGFAVGRLSQPDDLPPAAPTTRFTLLVASSMELAENSGTLVLFSPDGRTLVFGARRNGVFGLYRRNLGELTTTLIPGTEGARSESFFSPDGRWLAFQVGPQLMKLNLSGGKPLAICDLPGQLRGGSWGADDTLILGQLGGGLLRVPAAGGQAIPVAKEKDALASWPQILRGGSHVLFTTSENEPDSGELRVLDLSTGTTRPVLQGVAGRVLSTGHLVFVRGDAVWAVPFDLDRLAVVGTEVPIERGIRVEGAGAPQIAVSDSGALAFVPGGIGLEVPRTLVWMDRRGDETPIPSLPPRPYVSARLSPHDERVALESYDQQRDIWIWDFARLSRLTSDPGRNRFPVWSPDGQRVAFSVAHGTTADVYWQAWNGTGQSEPLTDGTVSAQPMAFAPDGRLLVLFGRDIGVVSPGQSRQVAPVLQTRFTESNAEVSPNGRWMAYQSDESGRSEIHVRPFPAVQTDHWQISTDGGTRPVWSKSGDELFYIAPPDAVMAMPVERGTTFVPRPPRKLFTSGDARPMGVTRSYDVSQDGRRFLFLKPATPTSPAAQEIVVVQNWAQELKRLAPAK